MSSSSAAVGSFGDILRLDVVLSFRFLGATSSPPSSAPRTILGLPLFLIFGMDDVTLDEGCSVDTSGAGVRRVDR